MRHVTAITLAVSLAGHVLQAQTTPMKPAAPGTAGDPKWQGIAKMSDGRTFVTDGGLALDIALAKPAALPDREVPGKVLEGYFNSAATDDFGFGDLTAAPGGGTYTTPKGIPLNATYIDYLRRVLPSRGVRFRMSGELQPVVVLVNGKPVGVLMPVRR